MPGHFGFLQSPPEAVWVLLNLSSPPSPSHGDVTDITYTPTPPRTKGSILLAMAAVLALSPPSLRSTSSLSFPGYNSPPFALAFPPLLPFPLSSYQSAVPRRSRAASVAPAGITLVSVNLFFDFSGNGILRNSALLQLLRAIHRSN